MAILETLTSGQPFEYVKLTPDEMKARGILGRLVGPISDYTNPTRNGRRYGEKLWDTAFADPLFQEKIENRCVFGELGHPADRQETDPSKICMCLAEIPKKKDGMLYGVFDIMNTPMGQILKSMCDYGCTIGVSSRGSGDLITDFDGQEAVDPDSFQLEGWDAVILPAVKSARMKSVNESLESKPSLDTYLAESIKNTIEEKDRQNVIESLNALGILLNEDLFNEESSEDGINTEENISDTNSTPNEQNDNTSESAVENNEAIVEELQEALKLNRKLDSKVVSLNEKLSVSYAKEMKLEEEVATLREQLARLQKKTNEQSDLNEQLESMKGEFSNKEASLNESLSKTKAQRNALSERLTKETNRLNESIAQKDIQIQELNEKLSKASKVNSKNKSIIESLQDEVETVKKDNSLIKENYSKKLDKSNQLVEKYKGIAKNAVNKYIESQAVRLGVKPQEIKNRLPESYGFRDIDKICESLQKYQVNLNNLPFSGRLNEGMKVEAISQPQSSILPQNKEDMINDFDLGLVKNLI